MALLLAVGITLCSLVILTLLTFNNQLHHRLEAYKSLHTAMVSEARKWERDYWAAHTEVSDLKADILPTIPSAPASHGVPPVDVERVMGDSDDPIWDLVRLCRAGGIFTDWQGWHPELDWAQPHRVYSDFATFISNLPEQQQNVEGVRLAVKNGG